MGHDFRAMDVAMTIQTTQLAKHASIGGSINAVCNRLWLCVLPPTNSCAKQTYQTNMGVEVGTKIIAGATVSSGS